MPQLPGKHELLDGELISLPPAKRKHNQIARRFWRLFETVLDDSRIFMGEGYKLRRGWLIPDVSANWPNQAEGEWFEGAPMIAIEIISRGNTAEEVDRKTDAYLEEGAAEVWVVYPGTRSMQVFRKDGALVRVSGTYDCESIGLQVDLQKLLPPVE
jgi:Uma2 family endonuclease